MKDWEKLVCCENILELEDEPYPNQAPWPSSTAQIDRLKDNRYAYCLRVRIWAIQTMLLKYEYHPISHHFYLWLDQHVPLM